MRNYEQIVDYCKNKSVFFGFSLQVLVPYLPFSYAKEFLKEEITENDWTPMQLTYDTVLNEMRDYMKFAWTKVEDHRGLSANRSIAKMMAWLFLIEDDALLKFVNGNNFPNYGAPILKAICEKYGFSIPNSKKIERMTQGLSCCENCNEGCKNKYTS